MEKRGGGSSSAVTGLGSALEVGGARGSVASSRHGRPWETLCVSALVAVSVVVAIPERLALLPALLVLAFVTPRLIVVDLREHRLPNRLVGCAALGVLLASLAEWLLDGRLDLIAMGAGATVGGVLLVLSLLGGLGMGDVKLGAVLAWMAALVDTSFAVLLVMIAVLVGGVQSTVVLLRTREGRGSIAFGPALLVGYWLPILWLAVVPG